MPYLPSCLSCLSLLFFSSNLGEKAHAIAAGDVDRRQGVIAEGVTGCKMAGPLAVERTARGLGGRNQEDAAVKWVTRSHVHMDRVACPWLIQRFVDSEAEFLFVPRVCVEEVARREGAIPFDVPGVELGHGEGTCSFDAVLRKYELKDKALVRLAKVVNAADLHKLDNDPIAAGLDAIATGFGIRFPDDHENLRQQFTVYDALYAWCRLEVAKDGQ